MNLIERKKINPNAAMKSFPLIAIEQFERLILSHNVEFRGGFYIESKSIDGGSKELYVPDTREVFCNTCKALAIVIEPKFDKDMREKYGKIKEKLKELTKEFIKATKADETIVLGESFYVESDKILLEQYNNMKVEIYQELFEALSSEFSKRRYWVKASADD